MASEDFNVQLDAQINYQAYQPFVPPDVTTINGLITTGAVTTINGDGGGSTSGPTVSVSGGTTGLTFTTGGASVTLSGTLAIAHGGTGATTVAGVLTALGLSKNNVAILAPTVTDDNTAGYSINSLWTDTVGARTYVCQDASTGAAVWVAFAP